jgi:hypothetical protein
MADAEIATHEAPPAGPVGSSVVDYTPKPPAAVRRAAQRAEELAAQAKAEREGTQEPDNTGTVVLPAEPELPLATPPQPDTWEHRYRTLQGKYDREIPQLRSQVSGLESVIGAMRNPPPPTPAPPAPGMSVTVSDEDVAAYGPELIESAQRWAEARLGPVVQDLRRQIDDLKGTQDKTAKDRTQDRVQVALDRDPELAPHWRQLNEDAAFIQWLAEIEPLSGVSRQVMLNHAYASGDAVRTGLFFKRYLTEHTAPLPQTSSGSTQTPPPNGAVAGSMDLTAFAAPGRSSAATPGPGAPEQRIWTNRDIQAFYDDRTRGRYRGREAEADRLERDIFAAASEGRIRNA